MRLLPQFPQLTQGEASLAFPSPISPPPAPWVGTVSGPSPNHCYEILPRTRLRIVVCPPALSPCLTQAPRRQDGGRWGGSPSPQLRSWPGSRLGHPLRSLCPCQGGTAEWPGVPLTWSWLAISYCWLPFLQSGSLDPAASELSAHWDGAPAPRSTGQCQPPSQSWGAGGALC